MIKVTKLQPIHRPAPLAAWATAWAVGLLLPVTINAALFAPRLASGSGVDMGSVPAAISAMLVIAVPATLAATAMFWRAEQAQEQPVRHWLKLAALMIAPFAAIAFLLNLSVLARPDATLLDDLMPVILLMGYSQLGALAVRGTLRAYVFLWPPASS